MLLPRGPTKVRNYHLPYAITNIQASQPAATAGAAHARAAGKRLAEAAKLPWCLRA